MKHIESVQILTSQIDDGDNTYSGLAVIINPMPTDEADVTQLGDDIKAVVMAFNRK